MAFFKFRKGADETPAAPPQPESIEVLRRRARHRLIGAAVLVLIGVVGFPLLFDTQPRPVAVDIPIEIPDRNKAKPLAAPVANAPRASEPVAAAPAKATSAPAAGRPVASGAVTGAPSAAKAEAKPEPKPAEAKVAEAKPEPRVEASRPAPVASKPQAAASKAAAPVATAKAPVPNEGDAARAQALLEGKALEGKPVQAGAPDTAGEGRFVVQVGAFTDEGKARQTQQKVAKAGLKNYTHVADTKDGKLIRVRAGPFTTRVEADKAAERLKELDLQARILTLP